MQASPASTYLHECARLHVDLTSRLSKQPQDIEAVEKVGARVRKRGALRYEDIEAIVKSPHFSAGTQFWTWPGRDEVVSALAGKKLDLWNLPKNERTLIKKLRSVFKTTDAVSVILRFVAPRDYGILSAPVEHVLGIQPSTSSTERYLAYLKDLRSIRDEYKFEAAARVDQALWTLQVGVHGGILPDTDHLKEAHAKDRFLRSLRVKNLADTLFGEMPRLELADALAGSRPGLAGLFAAIEFECAVRDYSNATPGEELVDVIRDCAPDHLRDHWQWCRSRRNHSVHGRHLNHLEVKELIQQTRNVLTLPRLRRKRKRTP